MALFTVITADVINSRQQGAVVEEKKKGLSELVSLELLTPFSFSRGDEIQGVCVSRQISPALLRQLRYFCLPLKLRIGIGWGRITSGLGVKSSWQMDGPAFYRARQALEEVKKDWRLHTMLVSGDQAFDQAVNALFTLYDTIQSRWTTEQWEGVMVYEEAGTYQKAADRLGVAFQNVEKRCRAAHWWAIQTAEEALQQMPSKLTSVHPLVGE